MQRVLIEKASVDDAEVSEVTEPPVKRKKSVLDRLLGDEYEDGRSSVSIVDEVKAYFQERPISHKTILFAGGKEVVVAFHAFPSWQRSFWQYQQPLHPQRGCFLLQV